MTEITLKEQMDKAYNQIETLVSAFDGLYDEAKDRSPDERVLIAETRAALAIALDDVKDLSDLYSKEGR